MVYLISDGTYTKIGVARNPKRRLVDLQTGSVVPLRLLGSIQGSFALEKQLHERYQKRRVRGEWFQLSPHEIASILQIEARPPISSTSDSLTFEEVIPSLSHTLKTTIPLYDETKTTSIGNETEKGALRVVALLRDLQDVQSYLELLALATLYDTLRTFPRSSHLYPLLDVLETNLYTAVAASRSLLNLPLPPERLLSIKPCRRYLPGVDAADTILQSGQGSLTPKLLVGLVRESDAFLQSQPLTIGYYDS